MFAREGLTVLVTNVRAMEIEQHQRFLDVLARPTGRLFQVKFDSTTLVGNPPTPRGHHPVGTIP
jgi:hypothetical protein